MSARDIFNEKTAIYKDISEQERILTKKAFKAEEEERLAFVELLAEEKILASHTWNAITRNYGFELLSSKFYDDCEELQYLPEQSSIDISNFSKLEINDGTVLIIIYRGEDIPNLLSKFSIKINSFDGDKLAEQLQKEIDSINELRKALFVEQS